MVTPRIWRLSVRLMRARMKAVGGVDLFLGGIGPDGHIAFNEPGSSLEFSYSYQDVNYRYDYR